MRSLAVAALLAAAPLAALAAPAPTPRYAVLFGNDHGAKGRPRLWFAEKDAERFRQALLELGDFAPERTVVVKGGTAAAFREAVAKVERMMEGPHARGERELLVVYFSGHAGPGGLELGDERVSYDELRSLAGRSLAEAKVVIVDACEAGALTQVKGARAEPSIDFALPSDLAQGTAFIASTAVGEAAQESAALGGSFFTHHLDVALRGAGDADGDGQVTLAEAFRYTAAKTTSATATTVAGPQHPTYDFKMSGRGDVVLADLRRAEATLRLPADPGALYVVKGPRGLLAEVPALAASLGLALPAGPYAIERRGKDGRARAELTLARGDDRQLPVLTPSRYEVARSKGGPLATEWFAGFGVATLGVPGTGAAPAVRAGFRRELGAFALRVRVDGAQASGGSGAERFTLSRVGTAATFLLPVAGGRRLLEAGVEVGGGWSSQSLRDGRSFTGGDATAGLNVVASAPLGRLRMALDLSAGGRAFELNGSRVVKPAGAVTAVLLYGR